jgi:hypothetical protein
MRPTLIQIHYNRQRAKDGLPWTVHVKGKCIPASQVITLVPCETVYHPEKKSNPRAWLKAKGYVSIEGDIVTVRPHQITLLD